MDQSTESWKPVVGYEGFYEVSDHGRVKSLERMVLGRNGSYRLLQDRILSLGVSTNDYRLVDLHRDGSRRTRMVHRLVLEAFVGRAPDETVCCHFDGNPSHNHLSNLRWDTLSANQVDSVRHGTHQRARKTRCPKGHPLAEPNLNAGGIRRGTRDCLACARGRQYARHHKIKFTQELADAYYERLLNAA